MSPELFVVGCGVRAAAEVLDEFTAADDAVESELETEMPITRSLPLTLGKIGSPSHRMSPTVPFLTRK